MHNKLFCNLSLFRISVFCETYMCDPIVIIIFLFIFVSFAFMIFRAEHMLRIKAKKQKQKKGGNTCLHYQ